MNPYNIIPHIRLVMYRKTYEGWTLLERTIGDHELVLITEGDGSFTVEGHKYLVKKGMLFYFYPGLVHSAETDTRNPMCFYAIHFNFVHVEYSSGLWTASSDDEILPLRPMQELKNYLVPLNLLKNTNTFWKEKGSGYEMVSRSLFQQALFYMFQDSKSNFVNFSAQLKIEKILHIIRDNPNKKYTLEDLSNITGLTIPCFSKTFKNITGYPAVVYLNRMKIDRAKEILLDSNIKINEVASSLGFKDEFYFSRLFKKMEGISPSEYRQRKIN